MNPFRTGVPTALLLAFLVACDSEPTQPAPPTPAPVASITLDPGALSILVGQTRTLGVVLKDADGRILNGRTHTFTSDKPGVASVTPAGQITGIGSGTARVTVASEGKSATAEVVVSMAPVAAVQVAPAALTLVPGTSQALTVILRDAQGSVLTGREITFVSAQPQVATVTPQGSVTGVAPGATYITVSSEGAAADVPVVVEAPVAQVEIIAAPDTLEAHDPHTLLALLRDENGNPVEARPLLWSSSDPSVATVDPETGGVIGLDRGRVVITATREGVSDSTEIEIVIRYRSLVAGTMHACDIASGGIAWCWGLNGLDGRIGLDEVGDGVHRTEPHRVPGDHRFTQLVAFSRFTCGLTEEGKAWCWGSNGWGALGGGSNVPFSSTPVPVAGNHTFVELSAGLDHACGIRSVTGTLLCWGQNDSGQFGRGNTSSANQPVEAAGGMAFRTVASGSYASCGLTPAGKAWCWGANGHGQSGNGGQIPYSNHFLSQPVAVAQGALVFDRLALGHYYACALTAGGEGYCWGSNLGKFGNGSTNDASSPTPIGGGHSFQALSTGYRHVCGVTAQGEVYCWGANGNGQLGASAQNGSPSPIRAGGNLRAAEVAAAGIGTGSGAHTCAISSDRLTTWCWGLNDVGQLGNGKTTGLHAVNSTPTVVIGQAPR